MNNDEQIRTNEQPDQMNKKAQTNKLLTCYDFTITSKNVDKEQIEDFLKLFGKHWSFQQEEGQTGYLHFQGRINLKVRKRFSTVKTFFKQYIKEFRWSPTSDTNKSNMFYVIKEETRINGPWTDKDQDRYIPRQYRNKLKNLRPFQQVIYDSKDIFEDRNINMIYCPIGNKGKSTIASLMEITENGIDLPIVNDAEKLIQSCCNIVMGKQTRTPSPIFIDLPRAMDKAKLRGIYTAIEQIKKGKLYDVRNKYKCWWIDSPQIWVFSNKPPLNELLSTDRWKIWTINEQYELIKYKFEQIKEPCKLQKIINKQNEEDDMKSWLAGLPPIEVIDLDQ